MTLYFLKLQEKVRQRKKKKETKNELSDVNNMLFLHLCQCHLPTNVGQLYSYYFTMLTSFH